MADIADPDLISSERDVLLRYLNEMREAFEAAMTKSMQEAQGD